MIVPAFLGINRGHLDFVRAVAAMAVIGEELADRAVIPKLLQAAVRLSITRSPASLGAGRPHAMRQ